MKNIILTEDEKRIIQSFYSGKEINESNVRLNNKNVSLNFVDDCCLPDENNLESQQLLKNSILSKVRYNYPRVFEKLELKPLETPKDVLTLLQKENIPISFDVDLEDGTPSFTLHMGSVDLNIQPHNLKADWHTRIKNKDVNFSAQFNQGNKNFTLGATIPIEKSKK